MSHRRECTCPPCLARVRPPESRIRSLRLTDEVWEWLTGRPEGPRGWIEQKVREARDAE